MTALPSHPVRIRYDPGDDLLTELYLPVLERAVRYDRLVGLASGDALARAAAGLDRLIRRGGSGRWLCGVRLTDVDVGRIDGGEAIDVVAAAALVRDLDDGDAIVRGRLAAVAWMLDHRHLDVRFALPLDEDGRALAEGDARALWTPEEAVVRDAEGHRLAWSGGGDACWTFASWPLNQPVLDLEFVYKLKVVIACKQDETVNAANSRDLRIRWWDRTAFLLLFSLDSSELFGFSLLEGSDNCIFQERMEIPEVLITPLARIDREVKLPKNGNRNTEPSLS